MSEEKNNSNRKYDRRMEKERERQKEKRELFLWKVGGGVFALAVIIALGVTVVNQYRAYQASRPDYNRTEMVVNDMAGVLEEETEAESETAAE